MSALQPISPVALQPGVAGLAPMAGLAPPIGSGNFASFLTQSLQTMETKVARADELVKQFALNDSIPVHQVTFALEEARLAVELAMQVRSRLLEGYRDLMNMQL